MGKPIIRWLFVLALLGGLPGALRSLASGPATARHFAETGHTVSDLFWQYWQAHGGLALFGYPISDEFSEISDANGKPYTVQYFERAVFELHPENASPYTVLLTRLGAPGYGAKYPAGAPSQTPAPGGQSFPQTGHVVGGRFLAFWQSHDGLATLGYPLSDEFTEKSELNGHLYTVQYFERAVLELHPENQAPYDVLLTQLGTLHFRQRYPQGAPHPAIPALGGPAPLPGDWPMYGHDAQHTSYNAGEHTLSAANVALLTSRWQADVGAGTSPAGSAPSVSNGRVYVGSGVQAGPNFFAFNTADGAVVWKQDLGFEDSCYRIGIGATAAISGSLVVAGGGAGAYYGLDAATGTRAWRDATDRQPADFAWTSPVFAGDRVIYGVASYCDRPQIAGEVRAVNAATGVLRNMLQLVPLGHVGASLWHSPALNPDGNALLLVTGEVRGDSRDEPFAQALLALDPPSFQVHAVNQQGPLPEYLDNDFASSPVVFHDARGRTLVSAHIKSDQFYVYDLTNIGAGPVWSKHIGTQIGLMDAYDPSARPGGMLFVPSVHGVLYAVDPATGQNLWVAKDLGVAHGNLAVANGLIFMNIDKVGVQVLDEQTGQVLRTLVPDHTGAVFSGIAVANGAVYWLSGNYLNAWGLPSGQP